MQTPTHRPNVAAVVLSSKYPFACDVLVAQRHDHTDAWQFPQGGIDKGESPQTALLRELKEEIGTNDVEIVGEYPKWLSYDFPKNAANKMKPFVGQTQRYFLVRLKDDSRVNIHTINPEFIDYKFISCAQVLGFVSSFKKQIYTEVLNYFKTNGYL